MKDCTTCKYGYEDEQLGIPMCHHPKRFSEDCVDFNMHEEKEIQESEKPIDIDFEQELYKHFGQVKDFTLGMRIGKYFYELGKQSGSSEIPNDLEEAAGEYEKEHTYQRYDGGGLTPEYNATLAEAVIFGAKWQKEQMMKEAMDADVNIYRDLAGGESWTEFVVAKPPKNLGDKVRVIIIKEDAL